MKTWLRRGVLAAWSASAGWAVDWTALKPQGCASDFAGVIDVSSKQELEVYCEAVERATGVRMALVTVRSLEGEPIEEAASALARAWSGGEGQQGILLLLSTEDRKSRLEAMPAIAAAVQPAKLTGSVLREMRPALNGQHYGEALKAAAETIGGAIAAERRAAVDARMLRRRIRPGIYEGFPWPLAIGGALLLVWLMRAGGRRGYGDAAAGSGFLPWMIRGESTQRSTWGSRGSGGFGGYDSGDGFAGFGGGDFGGGGASSDW